MLRYSLPSLLQDASCSTCCTIPSSTPFRLVSCMPSSIRDSQLLFRSTSNEHVKANGIGDGQWRKRKRDAIESFLRANTSRGTDTNRNDTYQYYWVSFYFGDYRSALYFWSLLNDEDWNTTTKRRKVGNEENATTHLGSSCQLPNSQLSYRLINYCLHGAPPGQSSLQPNFSKACTLDLAISDSEASVDRSPSTTTVPSPQERRDSTVILFITVRDVTRIDCDLWWYG